MKMVQLISTGKVRFPLPCFHRLTYADIEQTSRLPKYTHPLLIPLFKSTSYDVFINAYPQSTELLHEIYDKERRTFSAVISWCSSLPRLTHPMTKNLGLISQAIARAPRWVLKKLTATDVPFTSQTLAKQSRLVQGMRSGSFCSSWCVYSLHPSFFHLPI